VNIRIRLLHASFGLGVAAAFVLGGGSICFAAPPAPAPATANSAPAAAGTDETPGAAAIDAARKQVALGKLDEAIRDLSKYVAEHPHEIEPAKYLGDLYFRATDLSSAERVYKSVLEMNPNERETHNRLGGIYAAQDRVPEAIDQFTESLPAASMAYSALIELHRKHGDLNSFVEFRKNLADGNTQDFAGQYNIGRIYDAMHNSTAAAFYLERAMWLQPRDCITLAALGSVYLDLKEQGRALEVLNRCISESHDDYASLVNRGDVYIAQSRYDLARIDFEHANRVNTEGPEAIVDLGYLEDLAGRWRQATELYLKALSINPLMREAYTNLGYDYNQHQLYALAEAAFLKGLSISPSDGRLHYLLGSTYADQGKKALALAEFQRAVGSPEDDVSKAASRELAALERGTSQ
jgi:tetratricopeptide (TPR) repeat protein